MRHFVLKVTNELSTGETYPALRVSYWSVVMTLSGLFRLL